MDPRIAAWEEWLLSRLVAYEQSGRKGLHPTLRYMQAWDEALGHPHRRYPILHIAGTNGKGSTASFLAAVLQAAGYRVGLHTSPHLHTFTERMRVNGQLPPADWVEAFLQRYRPTIEALNLSFFEATVGMSFAWFAEAAVDVAVIEVGLGGRWDATNILSPHLCVITAIGEDHKEILGPTIADIAREKAGILKAGCPAVIAPAQLPAARAVLEAVAADQGAPLLWAPENLFTPAGWREGDHRLYRTFRHEPSAQLYETPLTGDYQAQNLSTVYTAIQHLRQVGWQIPERAFSAGVYEVIQRTGLHGRAEWLRRNGTWYLLDIGHNPPAFAALHEFLQKVPIPLQGLVIGFSREKDVEAALHALGGWAGPVFFTQAQNKRALPATALQAIGRPLGYIGEAYTTVAEALAAAQTQCRGILVTGSAFVVAEAHRALLATTPQQ